MPRQELFSLLQRIIENNCKGRCGHCVMCPLLHVIGAHTLGGVGERAFLCGVRMLSLCPQGVLMSPQLTKAMQYHCDYTASSWPEGRITDEMDKLRMIT